MTNSVPIREFVAQGVGLPDGQTAKMMKSLERLRVAALLNASAGTIERQGVTMLRDVLASLFEINRISASLAGC